MLITIDESFRHLSQHLRDLSSSHRLLVATANRPYALALASFFALQTTEQTCPLIGIASTREEALACLDGISEPVLPSSVSSWRNAGGWIWLKTSSGVPFRSLQSPRCSPSKGLIRL